MIKSYTGIHEILVKLLNKRVYTGMKKCNLSEELRGVIRTLNSLKFKTLQLSIHKIDQDSSGS